MPVIGPAKQTQPSYASGYAKSASESDHPNLWDGLLGAWMPGLGVTGGTLRDVSGNENHGTLTNMDPATDWVTTSKGLALDFDGSDDYAKTSANDRYKVSGGEITVLQWIKLDTYPSSGGYSFWDSLPLGGNGTRSNSFVTVIMASDRKLSLFSEGFFKTHAKQLNLNQWHLIGFRRKSTATNQTDLIIDTDFSAITFGTSLLTGDNVWGRVSNASAYYFDGKMSSCFFWDRCLSDPEIKQLYVDPLAPFRQRRSIPFGITAAPSFNNWYARPGRTNRIVGSGVHV